MIVSTTVSSQSSTQSMATCGDACGAKWGGQLMGWNPDSHAPIYFIDWAPFRFYIAYYFCIKSDLSLTPVMIKMIALNVLKV